MIDFIINDVSAFLCLPEETIVRQGQQGDTLFLIAKGDCTVWVKDHMKTSVFVSKLGQGDYFGEVSILTNSPRTATVKSTNYSTMACINKGKFYDLCSNFPDILMKMQQKALQYTDPWTKFKLALLHQVDYFAENFEQESEFYKELQFHMADEYFEEGTEIITEGEQCKSMLFVVSGQIELLCEDVYGNDHHLGYLQQGDVIGQYSFLFDEQFRFSAKSMTKVRVLSLSQEVLIENQTVIDGLEEAINTAEIMVRDTKVPSCDFK